MTRVEVSNITLPEGVGIISLQKVTLVLSLEGWESGWWTDVKEKDIYSFKKRKKGNSGVEHMGLKLGSMFKNEQVSSMPNPWEVKGS